MDCEYRLAHALAHMKMNRKKKNIKNRDSIADHETGDAAFGSFSEIVMVSKEMNV